jgi:hypothetical protein
MIAATPRTIPIREEIPLLPVAFLNRKRLIIPSRTAAMATIRVRIPHERIPRIRLVIPSQFLLRFGAAPGAGAGAGIGAAAVTGGGTGITGDNGTGGAATADCAAGCRRGRGFPQFLQN